MSENWTFFKQWLKKPTQLGTFLPISKKFAKDAIAKMIKQHHLKDLSKVKVLELGAGTGRITKVLLDAGFENITAIELNPDLANLMKKRLKDKVTVIQDDARMATKHFQKHSFDIVVSSLPFMYIPNPTRQEIVDAAFVALKKDGIFLHLCYTPSANWFHLNHVKLEKTLTQWAHFPTGFVYEFSKTA